MIARVSQTRETAFELQETKKTVLMIMLHLNCSLRVRYISDMALFCIRIADITWSILTLSKFAGATSLGPQC